MSTNEQNTNVYAMRPRETAKIKCCFDDCDEYFWKLSPEHKACVKHGPRLKRLRDQERRARQKAKRA